MQSEAWPKSAVYDTHHFLIKCSVECIWEPKKHELVSGNSNKQITFWTKCHWISSPHKRKNVFTYELKGCTNSLTALHYQQRHSATFERQKLQLPAPKKILDQFSRTAQRNEIKYDDRHDYRPCHPQRYTWRTQEGYFEYDEVSPCLEYFHGG